MRGDTSENNADRREGDRNSYREFLCLWEIGTLTEDNEIYRKVEISSLDICRKYGKPERVMDVCHTCLAALAQRRSDHGSLGADIDDILDKEVVSVWNIRSEIDGEGLAGSPKSRRALHIVEEVFRRLNSEPNIRSLLASRFDLKRNIIELILASDCYGLPIQNKILRTLTPSSSAAAENPAGRPVERSLRTRMGESLERFGSFFHKTGHFGLSQNPGILNH